MTAPLQKSEDYEEWLTRFVGFLFVNLHTEEEKYQQPHC